MKNFGKITTNCLKCRRQVKFRNIDSTKNQVCGFVDLLLVTCGGESVVS